MYSILCANVGLAKSFFNRFFNFNDKSLKFVFTFFFCFFLKKMTATTTRDKMDKMDTGEEKGEEGEQEREIDPSKTLISNVSLIKKSVESKGEPRFIASVFRQVCFFYSRTPRCLFCARSHHHHRPK